MPVDSALTTSFGTRHRVAKLELRAEPRSSAATEEGCAAAVADPASEDGVVGTFPLLARALEHALLVASAGAGGVAVLRPFDTIGEFFTAAIGAARARDREAVVAFLLHARRELVPQSCAGVPGAAAHGLLHCAGEVIIEAEDARAGTDSCETACVDTDGRWLSACEDATLAALHAEALGSASRGWRYGLADGAALRRRKVDVFARGDDRGSTSWGEGADGDHSEKDADGEALRGGPSRRCEHAGDGITGGTIVHSAALSVIVDLETRGSIPEPMMPSR